jgi:O-antigen/teichoic acid export membrane protein
MPNTIRIGRKDVLWNYAATFLQIGVGVILLPFILRVFPQETVAVWTIFTTIIALTSLLDFGFNPSFARNVSYVVSGVRELKASGYNIVESHNSEVDYSLFKGLIGAMRWFYTRTAAVLFALLATAGTYYIYTILKAYSGDHTEVYIAWAILVAINAYSLYTMYYDSLMQGKGLIKRSKQIQIVGQSAYLVVAVVLILLRFNLIAVVSAQALSIIIRRILSYRTIYTDEFKQQLRSVKARTRKQVLKAIYPNAVKMGLNNLAAFAVQRSSVILGALYLSLSDIASYGITVQIAWIILSLANGYFYTYVPKVTQQQVQMNIHGVKQIYLKGLGLSLLIFVVLGLSLVCYGEPILHVIKSQTPLLPENLIIIMLLIACHESFIQITSNIPLTRNEVPFFKISLIIGAMTVILMFIFLQYTNLGVWGLIIAPGIAECLHWTWMTRVIKELKISKHDIYQSLCSMKNILV